MSDETQRFEDRVQDYLLSRPGYPRQILDVIRPVMGESEPEGLSGWRLGWRVADVGAGTGLLAQPFLEAGCEVMGVEPSPSMREAAARVLARFPGFSAQEGRAEATGLPDGSVDLVVAGQAFHWFSAGEAVKEWQRILRGPSAVALVWNRRREAGTAFLEAYETFLRSWGTDYEAVRERYESQDDRRTVFGEVPAPVSLPNRQRLGPQGLVARLRSCSYLPGVEHPRHVDMLRAAQGLFDAHARGGVVELVYDTVVYTGRIAGGGGAPTPARH